MNWTPKKILDKLLYNDCLGAGHMLAETIANGLPRHLHGEIKTELKTLVKEGYIIKHPTKNGPAYFINPFKVAEIQKILDLL
jgi:hypothetical protein